MELRTFLDRVLPQSGGQFFGASVNPTNNKFSQSKLDSLDALTSYVQSRKKLHHNVYFATGVYKDKREIEKTVFKRALYLDIDCGTGKPYATKKDGLLALQKFCKDSGVPWPNILVDSGGGLHPYWTFDQDVSLEIWLPLSQALKSLCEQYGLEPDVGITTDAARILRVPTTHNFKNPDNIRPVRVLQSKPFDFSVDQLRKTLCGSADGAKAKLGALVNDDDLSDNLWQQDHRPRFAGPIFDKCAVMAHSLKTGGAEQAGEFWIRQLHLLAHTTDGQDYIHSVSEGHSEYDFNRTERRFAYAKARAEDGVGPTLCKTLEMWSPSKCKDCKWNGHISTPLQLGVEHHSDMPYGFKQDSGGIYRAIHTANDDGSNTLEWVKVLSFCVKNFQAFFNRDSNDGTISTFDVEASGTTLNVVLPLGLLHDRRAACQRLDSQGLVLDSDNSEYKHFSKLMTAWYKKMQQAKEVRRHTSKLGWITVDGQPAFSLIDRILLAGGDSKEAVFIEKGISNQFTPKGDKELWLKLAHRLTTENRHPINAAVLSAFAAPLIAFSGVAGAMLSIVSEESGTGKSTALRLAQAVWGNPTTGVHALNDTVNSVIKRMGFLNTLPAYWDELRMREDVKNFVKLVFQLGQGKEKSRLRADTSSQDVGTWKTLITVASNESVSDQIQYMAGSTDAGVLRAFEVKVDSIEGKDDVKYMARKLDDNFGHIGAIYARYLVDNYKEVEAQLMSMDSKLTAALNIHANERFRLAVMSSLIVSAQLATKLGFVSMDVPGFVTWIVTEFKSMREEIRQDREELPDRAKSLALSFVNANCDQFLVTDFLSTKQNKGDVGALYHQPQYGEPLGVIARKDKKLRLSQPHFKEWIGKNHRNESAKWLVDELRKQGAVLNRASVSGGLAKGVSTRVRCIEIKLDSSAFRNLIEYLPDEVTDAFEEV